MKTRLISMGLWICMVTLGLAQGASSLCVMSYNLRFASSNGPNAWPDRGPIMRECIQKIAPDVFGTQEGVYYQLKELASDLKEYDWIGLGRDGGSKGEFMAVFYRKTRLEPVAFDHYWLSDTPEVIGSSTWGNSNKRMVTWVLFKDITNGRQFYFVNTHFDHQIQVAREKSAQLVRERLGTLNPEVPLFLVGDFNAVGGKNKAYDILTADDFLKDTWKTASKRINEGIATFNNFKSIQPTGDRIDWILTRGNITTSETEIVTCARDGQFPSDHFPIVARVRIE